MVFQWNLSIHLNLCIQYSYKHHCSIRFIHLNVGLDCNVINTYLNLPLVPFIILKDEAIITLVNSRIGVIVRDSFTDFVKPHCYRLLLIRRMIRGVR